MLINAILALLKFLYCFIVTFPRDLGIVKTIITLKLKVRHIDNNTPTVADVFHTWVKKQPNKPCIVYYDKIWTFQDVNSFFN
jgi:hypothetical protein